MKDLIKQTVREAIAEHILADKTEQIDESVALAAVAVALGGTWAWVRKWVMDMKKSIGLEEFLEAYDQGKIIEKQIPAMLRKFKLINSLNDLKTMEADADKAIKAIEIMLTNVDKFVDDSVSDEATWMNKAMLRSPANVKRNLKKHIEDFVTNSKKSFARSIEYKTHELLD